MRLLIIIFLIPVSAAININCEFSDLGWQYLGNQYTCHVKNLQLESANAVVEGINGVHSSGKSHDDVIALNIQNQVCHFMPRRFEKFFKNIEGLQVYISVLKAIFKEDLKQFPLLKSFYIMDCKLTVIQPDLFEYNPKLKYINFDGNRIRSIVPATFDSIDDLEQLHMSGNVCISKSAAERKGVSVDCPCPCCSRRSRCPLWY